jgi:2-polyprenyl-6-methoxyphenol hydroxylase-like FAD-dependent oxidoreductase
MSSAVRGWGGFRARRDADWNLVAGAWFQAMTAPEDACHFWLNPSLGQTVLIFPQGGGRARAYLCYPAGAGHRLGGKGDLHGFVEESLKTGAPADYYAGARAAGPLATFDGASIWVEHPYRIGVALIGDAAAASDPTWGQGLSLAVRDARVLRDCLLRYEDWDEAGNAYALEHDRYYGVTHTMESWMNQMLMETGPEADARRARVLPLWREDRSRQPDVFFSGPDQTLGEGARLRFFGEAP